MDCITRLSGLGDDYVHQRLLKVLLGEGNDCFMLYWRKIALHKLLRDGLRQK